MIDDHLIRLNWTQEQGKEYLIKKYGKKSRQLLSDDELIEFLNTLSELQHNPIIQYSNNSLNDILK